MPGVSAAEKYASIGGRENAPRCECHGEPMRWQKDNIREAGGHWRCTKGGCRDLWRARVIEDLAGRVVGQWQILGRGPNGRRRNETQWWCECACGSVRLLAASSLIRGRTKCCRECWRHKAGHSEETRVKMREIKDRQARERIAREGPRWRRCEFKKSNGTYIGWRASIPPSILVAAEVAGVKFKGRTQARSRSYSVTIMEHVLVMEQALGRPVDPRIEQVHHKDGNPSNNDPSNLELRAIRTHGPGSPVHELHQAIDALRAERDALQAQLDGLALSA